MRLHRLEITGIGPFRDTQVIDFDDVSTSGLFLIEGPTGSGKTTIIDAIVYAMFGVVSAGSDDVTRMRIRSHYCTETDPTGVTCEFSVDGRRFRVSRIPAGCRDPHDPQRAAKAKGPRQSLVEIDADGAEGEPLATRRDVDGRIEALLGMSVEQFRQLVVLPQGQFADLLRQTPAERLKSLEPLLENGVIAAVQADLEVQGRLAREQREAAATRVDQAAQRLAGRLKAWLAQMPPEVSFTDAGVDDQARLAVVDDILAALSKAADRASSARDEQGEQVTALRESARVAADIRDTLQQVADARSAVDAATSSLDAGDVDVTEEDIAGRLADLQRLEGALQTHADWEGGAAERDRQRTELADRARQHRDAAATCVTEQQHLPAEQAALEARRAAAQELSGGLAAAERERSRLQQLIDTLRTYRAAVEQVDALAATAARAAQKAETARQGAHDADTAWRALLARQHADAAALLAVGLTPGSACPVCGSTEHPAPAPLPDGGGGALTDQVEAAAEAADTARGLADSAQAAAATAHAQHIDATTQAAVLSGALGDHDEESLRTALAVADQHVTAAQEAVAALPEIDTRLRALDARDRELTESSAAQEAEATRLEATIAADETTDTERSEQIRHLIGAVESATVLLRQVRQRASTLSSLQQAWSARAIAIARVPADLRDLTVDQASARADDLAAQQATAGQLLASLTEEATTATATLTEATPLAAAFRGALADRQRTITDTEAPLTLAALVTAGNAKHLQLRSYALQRRFATVLAAATAHLERMSSGKFAFEMSEAAAKAGQSGLGIMLLDSWTGQPQDPKSLSGGETFYASLALALGLADVVRGEAGGSALETLFVDEGFGALDQDTLSQVLEQLDQLRAGNRVVGVVSHVTEMKESIPDRIEVRRQSDRTSTIHQSSA